MLKILFSWIFISQANVIADHPFHVSVCDMVYKSQDKHLKISVRIFLDDMEIALQDYTGDLKLDITDATKRDYVKVKTGQYLLEKLEIKYEKQPLKIHYLGMEQEEDVLWAYLEVTNLKPFSQLQISFTALLETYTDQENLVHVRRDGVVRSLRLNSKVKDGMVKW